MISSIDDLRTALDAVGKNVSFRHGMVLLFACGGSDDIPLEQVSACLFRWFSKSRTEVAA